MEDALKTIQLLVAPVIMISANGLLSLAMYNRLAAIVSRTRTFHKERFDALTHLTAMPLEEQTSPRAHHLRRRAAELEQQAVRILRRARLVRNALMLMIAAVSCMLVCSLSLGLTMLVPGAVWLPLVLFFAGTCMMLAGTVLALLELSAALEPVQAEGDSVDDEDQV